MLSLCALEAFCGEIEYYYKAGEKMMKKLPNRKVNGQDAEKLALEKLAKEYQELCKGTSDAQGWSAAHYMLAFLPIALL